MVRLVLSKEGGGVYKYCYTTEIEVDEERAEEIRKLFANYRELDDGEEVLDKLCYVGELGCGGWKKCPVPPEELKLVGGAEAVQGWIYEDLDASDADYSCEG